MGDALSSQPIQLPSNPTIGPQAATKDYVDNLTSGKVSKSGDTMLASLYLTVAGSPANNEAVDKQWVDARIISGAGGALQAVNIQFTPTGNVSATNVQDAINEVDTEKVKKAGDTMLGFLTLNADPTLNLHAVTKQYADQFSTKIISQPDVLSTWTINHNMNRYPAVTTRDSIGTVVHGVVNYTNANTITIEFGTSLSGTVYLN